MKTQEELVPAELANAAHEALAKKATGQVAAQLVLDKARESAPLLLQLGKEGLQVLAHNLMKDALLRLSALIAPRQRLESRAWLALVGLSIPSSPHPSPLRR